MSTTVAYPVTGGSPAVYGMKSVYGSVPVGLGAAYNTVVERGLKQWSLVQTASADPSAVTDLSVTFSSAPTAGNLLVCVVTINTSTRVAPPANKDWSEVVDGGATGRGIAIYWRFEGRDSGGGAVTTGTTAQAFTAAANVTGEIRMMEFSGPVPSNAATSADLESFTSVTNKAITLLNRDDARYPRLRISAVALNGTGASNCSLSGGDNLSSIVSTTRHGIAWDRESETATTYSDGGSVTSHTWAWGGTSISGHSVTWEFGGSGVGSSAALDANGRVGYASLGGGDYRVGMLFDTAPIPNDDVISSASIQFCIPTGEMNMQTGSAVEVIAGRLGNNITTFAATTTYEEVYQAEAALSATTLASMDKANFTTGATNYNDLNGSSGLNSSSNLVSAISKTGATNVTFIHELGRTSNYNNTSNDTILIYGPSTASTTSDPKLVVEHAPAAQTISATGIASTAAVGSPSAASKYSFTATGIGSTAAVGSPTTASKYSFSATGIASTEALGAPAVELGSSAAQSITATGIDSAAAVGSPTVTPGAVSIAATGIAATSEVGAPTAAPGAVGIAPSGITSTADVGAVTLTAGTTTVAVTGIGSTVAVGAPTVGSYTTTFLLAVQQPDQAAVGQVVSLVAQVMDSSGGAHAFAVAPSIRIYSVDASTGAETNEVATTSMSQIGSTDSWKYDWTPSSAGTFVVLVSGVQGATVLASARSVSARPRFDPVALALSGQLVSRF